MAETNELMLREMRSQSRDLASALVDMRAAAGRLAIVRPTKVVLTGSGDSAFAASAVEFAYGDQLGVPVWSLPSATAARYGRHRTDGLTIVISVSGEVRRSLEAAKTAKAEGGQVLAITANADSSLARSADGSLVMPPPITRATPHTRDYSMTLLALLALLERLTETHIHELDSWPNQVDVILDLSMPWAERLAQRYANDHSPVWFLGMGPDRGTAAYGALKFWEAGGSAAWSDDLEEFGHGSQLIARPGEVAVLFAYGAAASRAFEMRPGIERMGLHTSVIGEGVATSLNDLGLPPIRSILSPLFTSLPPQALAYWFATRRGIDVTLGLGDGPLGKVYDDVHQEWMRESAIIEAGPRDGT